MLHNKLSYPTIAFLLLWVMTATQAHAQTKNYRFQAFYILNFTKYIEWPKQDNDRFVVGVLGSQYTSRTISRTLSGRKIASNGSTIVVKRFPSISQIKDCDILFVSANSTNNIRRVIRKTNGHSTLIVTEKEGFIGKGSCINFVVKNRKMRYEINPPQINHFGLTVKNDKILTLAVNTPTHQNATE
ncbi:YfiR family protein [uncultured Microscilla sp.]|uniref:YfiR family protein n=1 Tax=uncultured Microscilla sp. TaxID=432653 RepID=UPI00261689DB|nr:YfiR family protein [uncultured Microscilla sp.]